MQTRGNNFLRLCHNKDMNDDMSKMIDDMQQIQKSLVDDVIHFIARFLLLFTWSFYNNEVKHIHSLTNCL